MMTSLHSTTMNIGFSTSGSFVGGVTPSSSADLGIRVAANFYVGDKAEGRKVIYSSASTVIIAGSKNSTGTRLTDQLDPGRFIKFEPGGNINTNAPLRQAIAEHAAFPEDHTGAGRAVDREFSGTLQSGRCIASTLSQCIK